LARYWTRNIMHHKVRDHWSRLRHILKSWMTNPLQIHAIAQQKKTRNGREVYMGLWYWADADNGHNLTHFQLDLVRLNEETDSWWGKKLERTQMLQRAFEKLKQRKLTEVLLHTEAAYRVPFLADYRRRKPHSHTWAQTVFLIYKHLPLGMSKWQPRRINFPSVILIYY